MPPLIQEETRKRKSRKFNISVPLWMVTFTDVTILLLTFFIILLTTAKIDGHELKIVLSNFPGLDKLFTGTTFVDGPLASQSVLLKSSISNTVATFFGEIEKRLTVIFNDLDINIVKFTSDERGLVVTLATDYFFERYSAKVNLSRFGELLRNVAEVLKYYSESGGYFRVEGHAGETDFPFGLEFDDVWELSSARAISIVQLFEKFLVPLDKTHVSGYGDTRPFIDEENDSVFNRRVDIILLDDGNL